MVKDQSVFLSIKLNVSDESQSSQLNYPEVESHWTFSLWVETVLSSSVPFLNDHPGLFPFPAGLVGS